VTLTPAKKVLIGVAVAAVLGLVVFFSLRGTDRDKGVEVDVEPAARREIARIVKASGVVDPRVKVNISAHVVGRIERMHVEEGDRIEAGQPVLELEREAFLAVRDDWRARLAQARTAVRQADVDLADARLRGRRMAQLGSEGVISQERQDEAELAETSARLRLDQAREQVRQAQANLVKAEDDLRKTTIYSPLSGRVIALNAEEGEVVVSGTMNNPASVIATIADLSEVLAEVDVDETEIVYVSVGQEGVLNVDAVGDRIYRGRVVEVGSSGFSRPDQPDVTFFKTKLLFLDPDDQLKPGMSVRAEIVTASHPDALVVPIQAVVEREREEGERVVGEAAGAAARRDGAAPGDDVPVQVVYLFADGAAERRPVTTGISDPTHVEILAGVDEGERVVTGPYRTLRDLEDGDDVKLDEKDEKKRDDADDGDEDDEDGDAADEAA